MRGREPCPSTWGDPFFGQARCRFEAGHEGRHQSATSALCWGPPPPVKPGDRVRCDYRDGHRGTVLAADDPRAWAGSIAFPAPNPDPAAVAAHARRYPAEPGRHPVLWDFGNIYWDRHLSPVAP